MQKILIGIICSTICIFDSFSDNYSERSHDNVSFTFENDLFSGKDSEYTNGFRVSWVSKKSTPSFISSLMTTLPNFHLETLNRYSFSFGQTMYTPEDLLSKDYIKDDRPYAGLLFVTFNVLKDSESTLDEYAVKLGVIGPMSLADKTQTFVHKKVGIPTPQGWKHQLKNEPILNLLYRKKYKNFLSYKNNHFESDVIPHSGFAFGNMDINASAGAIMRLGKNINSDYGPPIVRPGTSGADFFTYSPEISGYLFVGVDNKAVVRDIFLDGNTFQKSHSIKKKPLWSELQLGYTISYKKFRFTHLQAIGTKQFYKQKGKEKFGSITLTYKHDL